MSDYVHRYSIRRQKSKRIQNCQDWLIRILNADVHPNDELKVAMTVKEKLCAIDIASDELTFNVPMY